MTEFSNEAAPGAAEDRIEKINRTITLYRTALKGAVDVHYWSSPLSEIMATRIALHGEEMTEQTVPPDMEPDFVRATQTVYSGIMKPEMLERRISELEAGLGDI